MVNNCPWILPPARNDPGGDLRGFINRMGINFVDNSKIGGLVEEIPRWVEERNFHFQNCRVLSRR